MHTSAGANPLPDSAQKAVTVLNMLADKVKELEGAADVQVAQDWDSVAQSLLTLKQLDARQAVKEAAHQSWSAEAEAPAINFNNVPGSLSPGARRTGPSHPKG